MTSEQLAIALTLLEDFNMESALAEAIGENLMYGTPEKDYEDVSTLGYAVMLNTEKSIIEIWQNITTEDRGWASVAMQQHPVVLLGYIKPNDAFASGAWVIEENVKEKMRVLREHAV